MHLAVIQLKLFIIEIKTADLMLTAFNSFGKTFMR